MDEHSMTKSPAENIPLAPLKTDFTKLAGRATTGRSQSTASTQSSLESFPEEQDAEQGEAQEQRKLSFSLSSLFKQPSLLFGRGSNERDSAVAPTPRASNFTNGPLASEESKTTEEETDELILARLQHSRHTSNASALEAKVLPPSSWFGEFQIGLQNTKNKVLGESPSEEEECDWDFWGKVMNDYENVVKSMPRQFQYNLHKGLPPPIRGMLWQLMANSKSESLEQEYLELLELPSRFEKIIKRDLGRTFPGHESFKDENGPGQQSLLNVLKAYSIYDKEVGYCQGLSFVAGALLMNMPEEQAFCVLVKLMMDYNFRDLYAPKMIGLQIRNFQFEKLLQIKFPKVFVHLEKQDVRSTMYASQWYCSLMRFMTLFAYRFPLDIVFRILDIILAEGSEAILRFALALIKGSVETILNLDFEKLLEYLKEDILTKYVNNINKLVSEATSISLNMKKLEQWEKECKEILRKQSPESMEAEQVKAENRAIVNRVKELEKSYELLNREHVNLVNKSILNDQKILDQETKIQELQQQVEVYQIMIKNERNLKSDEADTLISQLTVKNNTLMHYSSSLENTIKDLEEKLKSTTNATASEDEKKRS